MAALEAAAADHPNFLGHRRPPQQLPAGVPRFGARLEEGTFQPVESEGAPQAATGPLDWAPHNQLQPPGHSVICMSQLLDCFAEDEIVSILKKVRAALPPGGRLWILELFWDRQRFEAAAFSLQQTSLYFTCVANGNSQIRDVGTGLALGILMDTFVVRTLLVPATVVLLGRWNWWPSALSRRPADLPAEPEPELAGAQ